MRRFTRPTNGFSKKVEAHANAVALHFMYYNFVRIHASLRMTPAMAAGITGKLWEIGDIVALSKRRKPRSRWLAARIGSRRRLVSFRQPTRN